MEKYKIMECLEKLTVSEYRIIIKVIPKLIGRSNNTFWNNTRIDINSKMDIPYVVVVKLERLFKLEPGGLINIPIDSKSIDEIILEHWRQRQ